MRNLSLFILLLFFSTGPKIAHAQPVTGTGPDSKMMWKQIAVDAFATAQAVRGGEFGQNWSQALVQLSDDRAIIFWAVVDYAKGSPPSDDIAKFAVAELWTALNELYLRHPSLSSGLTLEELILDLRPTNP